MSLRVDGAEQGKGVGRSHTMASRYMRRGHERDASVCADQSLTRPDTGSPRHLRVEHTSNFCTASAYRVGYII